MSFPPVNSRPPDMTIKGFFIISSFLRARLAATDWVFLKIWVYYSMNDLKSHRPGMRIPKIDKSVTKNLLK